MHTSRAVRLCWLTVLVFALVAASLPARPAAAQQAQPLETIRVGESVEGQPIEAYRFGSGSRSIVIVGAIHGSEGNAAVLTRDLQAFFSANLHLLPPDTSLYFLPALNPDGLARNSRYNANGVDLNRNWDTPNWQPDTYDASGFVPGGGGSAPFSEPETAAMAGWLLQLREQSSSVVAVFYHSAYPPRGLVLSGSVGAPTTPAFADVIGYAIPAPGRGWSSYPVTGLAPSWCRTQGIGCFEVELPSRANLTADQTARHAAAVLGVLLWGQVERGQQCFLETGFCIGGRVRDYWARNGGLVVFGLPIGPLETRPVAAGDGEMVERPVQWFERTRLEVHRENAAPYDILLGRLGVELLEQQGRNWWTFPRATDQLAEQAAAQECQEFADTGHTVCGPILQAWRSNGLEIDGRAGSSEAESLALFGLPVSAPQQETLPDGAVYTVQWFERARFELHPDNPAPANVLLGRLSDELHTTRGEGSPQPASLPAPLEYVFPVQGATADYGPFHHDYPAADIFAPTGTPFVATTSGVVEFVRRTDEWNPATNRPEDRGGMAVSIIGDDGVRYYGSHLSGVADGITVGTRVAAGQLLGWVGKSGNARSTPPHLHYGISRPTHAYDWATRRGHVPPYDYLRAWQRGEMFTPVLDGTLPPANDSSI